jgi:hypothetical protein
MTTKTITAAVMALGLVAACAGGAHAGHGGNGLPGSGGSLFQCYFINGGVKSGDVLDMNDQFTDPTNVKIGSAVLLCTPADATTVGGAGNFNAFNFPPLGTDDPDHILCYEAQDSNSVPTGATVTLRDPLSPGGQQTVKVASTKYVCVQAIKTCVSGCPVE